MHEARDRGPDDRWWDAFRQGSFFHEVYRLGDQSLDGWVEGRELDLSQRTRREAEGVLRLLDPGPSEVILDCPCGYARHSVFFAERGLRVIGVDRCLDYLQHPAQSAIPRDTPYLACSDMRSLPLKDNSVTIVLNLVLSFGFFQADEDNLRVLQEFSRVLAPGGRFLLHTDVNPLRLEDGTYGDRVHRRLPKGGSLIVEESFDRATRRLHGSWTIHELGGASRTANYNLRVYWPEEFKAMLAQAGLSLLAVHGGFDSGQEQFSGTSQEVIHVAAKEC